MDFTDAPKEELLELRWLDVNWRCHMKRHNYKGFGFKQGMKRLKIESKKCRQCVS